MIRMRCALRVVTGALLSGALLGAGDPGDRARSECPAASADTATWRRTDGYAYTLRLPRGYRRVRTRGIDSAPRAWRAPGGREIHADYGPTEYVGDGIRDDSSLLCEGIPNGPRRIGLYRDRGVHGIGYYGLDPHDSRRSLILTAESPREADIPELLAIAHSIRWVPR